MAFISGIASISPQKSFGNQPYQSSHASNGLLTCIEPDYTHWIDQRAIRRMSKVIRMGVAAAALALKEAGIEKPDAIIAGTGLGCVTDTAQFLTKLVENKEEALNPTPFIQSTHNTIASQIALLLQCLGYNQTYSQRGFSFECALQDALMSLDENPEYRILVGGIDETTETVATLLNQIGLSANQGEGSAFFVLSASATNAWAQVLGIRTVYKPNNSGAVMRAMNSLLEEAGMQLNDIDLVFLGDCGNEKFDGVINEVAKLFSGSTMQSSFKNFCGEYSTSTSFALWLAAMAIKKGFVPGNDNIKSVKSILIYNQYFNQHHSLILLKSC